MAAIVIFLVRLDGRAPQPRMSATQQEAIWAKERAQAPFQLHLRAADGSKVRFSVGGRGYVVIQPDRVEDLGLAVGGLASVYAPRRGQQYPAWHTTIQEQDFVDSGFPLGPAVAWPGGDLRQVKLADAQEVHPFGPLQPGDLLAYAPAERLLVHCYREGSCLMVFKADRFRVRMVFHQRDRPIIRQIAADLRRCIPQWDGRIVEIVAPTPGCQPA